MLKKIISLLLLIAMLISISACGTPTPSLIPTSTLIPTPTEEAESSEQNADFTYLKKYTIVYPSGYTALELEEVKLLQDTIKELTGIYLPVISDTEPEKENEIILATSQRQTGVSGMVSAFAHELDYIVAFDGNDIVLGGKHAYADMKAVYDFINNYLGYDDIENVYSAPSEKLEGTKTVLYKEPAIIITAPVEGTTPFASQKDVQIMAEAGFNMTRIDTTRFTVDEFRHYAKWCARYNIRILQRGAYIDSESKFLQPDEEYMKDCPVIYGHWVMENKRTGDLPIYERLCATYKEQFEGYGWKLVFAMQSATSKANLEKNIFGKQSTDIFLDGANTFSVLQDIKTGAPSLSRDEDRFNASNIIRKIADETDRDMWIRITAINTGIEDLGTVPFEPQSYNTKKQNWLRWAAYAALSFGVTGVEYEYYKHGHVVNDDFSKSELFDTVKAVNEEILAVAEILSDYEWQGVYVQNQDYDDPFGVMDTPIADPENYINVMPANGFEKQYLIACFKAKDGSDNNAVIVFNTEELPDQVSAVPSSKAEYKGKQIYTYKNSEVTALEQRPDGKYTLSIKNYSELVFTKD